MSDRNFPDWITAYMQYAAVTEAPKRMHFWAAVGGIAGALRRRVWIDMKRFTWTPSFYIIFVAPPGVVAKSTTADIVMELLKAVPGIKFGPNSVTWQALVSAFAGASEAFEWNGEFHPMSPLTLTAGELGSLLNPQDKQLVDLLIELWDGKKKYEKITKASGNDTIEAPWINLMGCTTPHWIADNIPPAMIGGGLSSRCLFIYADTKERYIAYVDEQVGEGDSDFKQALIHDLEKISLIVGPYTIDARARAWGKEWYERFWKEATARMDDAMLEGYAARKQTHLHKTAMVLSASRGDSRIITQEDLELANVMLEDLERDMPLVFSRMGRSNESIQADRFIDYIRRKGPVPYDDAYRMIHTSFPDFRDFEGIINGAIRSGQIKMFIGPKGMMLEALETNHA